MKQGKNQVHQTQDFKLENVKNQVLIDRGLERIGLLDKILAIVDYWSGCEQGSPVLSEGGSAQCGSPTWKDGSTVLSNSILSKQVQNPKLLGRISARTFLPEALLLEAQGVLKPRTLLSELRSTQ